VKNKPSEPNWTFQLSSSSERKIPKKIGFKEMLFRAFMVAMVGFQPTRA